MQPTALSPPTPSTPAAVRLRQYRGLLLARVAGRSPSIPRGNTSISEPLREFRVTISIPPPARLVWDLERLENKEFSGSQSWGDADRRPGRVAVLVVADTQSKTVCVAFALSLADQRHASNWETIQSLGTAAVFLAERQ